MFEQKNLRLDFSEKLHLVGCCQHPRDSFKPIRREGDLVCTFVIWNYANLHIIYYSNDT